MARFRALGKAESLFTGIVEELGELVRRDDLSDAARLAVRGPLVCSDARPGDSIAVNGVCLTVVEVDCGVFTADVMGETLRRSSLGTAGIGDRLNLERAAKLGDRLGGHLVQGHVDAVGTVLTRTAPHESALSQLTSATSTSATSTSAKSTSAESAPHESAQWELVRIGMPARLARYVVEKGSITVDGVSLTVVETGINDFSVGLIPTTRELTNLGLRCPGELVNLEVDVIAKYVERLTAPHLAAGRGGPEG